MGRPSIVIVSPAAEGANNGNARTAARWAAMLAGFDVRVVREWPGGDGDVMLALHARRSASSVAAWHAARGARGLGVVLTGTDLYRDLAGDEAARRSLRLASHLVVLQERGTSALPADARSKARVIFQSTPSAEPATRPASHVVALAVGHLRPEKAPETLFAAARLLRDEPLLRFDHIGDAEGEWRDAVRTTAAACPNYRWLGPMAHAEARERIRQAHVLVHPSRIEGGAHVVMEAIRSGTPVLASRVDGNVGMLGEDYGGYFDVEDAAGLAALLRQGLDSDLLARLRAQCDARAPLFDPATEERALLALVHDLLAAS